MQNLLGEVGATTPGLYAAVACDKKELKVAFLKDVMGLYPSQQPDKALKAQIDLRKGRSTYSCLVDVLNPQRSRSESPGRESSHFPAEANQRAGLVDSSKGLREVGGEAR